MRGIYIVTTPGMRKKKLKNKIVGGYVVIVLVFSSSGP